MPQVDTHCPYCALQCGMRLDGARVTPRDFPVNAGGLILIDPSTAAGT